MLRYGKRYKFFERLQRKGKRTPLDVMPEMDDITEWYLHHYNNVVGFGEPSLQGVVAYGDSLDLPRDIDEFVSIMASLYIAHRQYEEERHGQRSDSKDRSRNKAGPSRTRQPPKRT